jgi:hypothetical protein
MWLNICARRRPGDPGAAARIDAVVTLLESIQDVTPRPARHG